VPTRRDVRARPRRAIGHGAEGASQTPFVVQIVWNPAVKSAVENLSPTRVKLTVEVPSEELQPHVDAALKSIGEQIQVPGFRKGKVPARIIEQRVGKGAVLQEAVNDSLPEFFGKAVEETGVEPIGQPEVDITQVPMKDEEQLEFTVEVDVRPEVTLPDYDGMQIQV